MRMSMYRFESDFHIKWNGEIGSHGKYYHKSLVVYNISWDGSRGSSQGSLP